CFYRELGRHAAGLLHGRRRALPPPSLCGHERGRDNGFDPAGSASAALPEPGLQSAERRHRARVRAGFITGAGEPLPAWNPALCTSAVLAAETDAVLAYRVAPVPYRSQWRPARAADARG